MDIYRLLTNPLLSPEGESAGGTAAASGGDGKSTDAAATGQQGKTADATGANGGEQAPTLTQAQVDKIIEDRLARAQTAADKKAKDAAEKASREKLDELTRTQKERDEAAEERDALKHSIRERDAKDSVLEAAKKAGASDGSPIWKMVKGDVAYDDDGKVTNLDELIKDAKLIAPQLFKPNTSTADAGAGNRSSAAQGSDWIRASMDRRR